MFVKWMTLPQLRRTTNAVSPPPTSPLKGTFFAGTLLAGALLSICGCEKQVAGPAVGTDAKSAGGSVSDEASEQPQTERVKAELGVGAKGKSGGSPIRQTVNAYFNSAERLRFMAVEHALNLYKAADPYGRGPKSHEEFMEKIVEFNQLQLPELPEGHRYVYDPEAGELMVERPAGQ